MITTVTVDDHNAPAMMVRTVMVINMMNIDIVRTDMEVQFPSTLSINRD